MLADVTLTLPQSALMFLGLHLFLTIGSGVLATYYLVKAGQSHDQNHTSSGDAYVAGVIISCVICGANLIMTFVMSWTLFLKAL